MTTPEQFSAAQKAQIDTLLSLGGKAFEGAEKLIELNLQVSKTLLSDTAETTMALLSIKDPQELVALQSGLLKPATEKLAAYNKQVYGIASATSAEFSKVAKAGLEDVQKGFMSAVDAVVKNAPAGSEGVVALFKSALEGATSAYDGLQKSGQQAAEVAAANFVALGDSVVKASSTPPPKVKRAA